MRRATLVAHARGGGSGCRHASSVGVPSHCNTMKPCFCSKVSLDDEIDLKQRRIPLISSSNGWNFESAASPDRLRTPASGPADRRPFRPCAAISSALDRDPEAISRRCGVRIPPLRNPISGFNIGCGGAALGPFAVLLLSLACTAPTVLTQLPPKVTRSGRQTGGASRRRRRPDRGRCWPPRRGGRREIGCAGGARTP
jgi:hypothetical protein